MKNLLTLNYWFSVNPGALTSFGFRVLLAIVIFLFILGLTSLVLKRKKSLYRGIFNRVYDLAVANFFIGLLFIFFHYENIPFFTARFWLLIWMAGLLVWAIFIIKKLNKIPEKRKELELLQEKKKYLPK